jgi:hypothetical protein
VISSIPAAAAAPASLWVQQQSCWPSADLLSKHAPKGAQTTQYNNSNTIKQNNMLGSNKHHVALC